MLWGQLGALYTKYDLYFYRVMNPVKNKVYCTNSYTTNIISAFINGRVKMDGSSKGSGHSEALRNYNLGRTLGIGTFGKVKIAEHKLTGHRVAIKIINCRQMRNMEMEEKGMVCYPVILHFH
jgi:serine/threonine protein kinase